MVSLIEAQQSVTQARQQLTTARQTLTEQEKEVEAVKFPQRSLRFQQEVIKRRPREFAGKIQQKKGKLKKEKTEAKRKIGLERSRLSEFERKEIAPVERQIKKIKTEQKEYARFRKLAIEGRWNIIGMIAAFGNPLQKKIAREYLVQRRLAREGQRRLQEDPDLLQSKVDLLVGKGLTEERALQKLGFERVEVPQVEAKGIKLDMKPGEVYSIGPIELGEAPPKVKSFLEPIKQKYQQLENLTRRKITEPYIFEPLARANLTKENLGKIVKLQTQLSLTPTPALFSKKGREKSFEAIAPIGDIQASIFKGGYKQVRDKPLETASFFVGGSVVGGGLKGLSIGAKTYKGLRVVEKGVKLGGIGLGGLYAGTTGYELYKAPTTESRAEIVGRETVRMTSLGLGSRFGARAVGFFGEPITVKAPIRKPITPQVTEVQIPVVKGGKQFQVGAFQIRGEKVPPMIKYKTTPFKAKFGLKPKTVEIIPAKEFVVKTLQPVIQGKPFTVGEYVAGRKGVKLKTLTGDSQVFKPRLEYQSLTRTEQYILQQQLARQTGTPVGRQQVPKFFERNQELTRSFIGTEELGRAIPGKRVFGFKQPTPGKTFTQTQAITQTKPFLKTEDYSIRTFETGFKDVSKPFARASGNIPRLQGAIQYFKKPVVLDQAPRETFGFKVFGGAKTPLSRTFAVTEQQIKPLPKPVIKAPKTPKVTVTARPTITSQILPMVPRTTTRTLPQEKSAYDMESFYKTYLEGKQQPISKPSIKTELRPIQKPVQKPFLKEIIKQQPKTTLKLAQKPLLKLAQKPVLKLTPEVPVPFFPRTPVTTPPPLIPGFDLPKRKAPKRKKKRTSRDLFQRTSYTPSLTGTTFKFRARKKPSKILGGYSFGIRPILR